MQTGIAVSPGVAIGTAYCIDEIFVSPDSRRLTDRDISAELAKYETARDKTARDLRALEEKAAKQIGMEAAAIFAMHVSILQDPAFTEDVRNWIIEERFSAQAALHRLSEQYSETFSRIQNGYLKERLTDVRDVIVRVSAHLSEALDPKSPALKGPLIIVANELLLSQVVKLDEIDVRGIVTQSGSQTSHAAIVARSRGIPAVSGVRNILKQVKTGDTIVVDGRDGKVAVKPDPESLAAYRKLEREFCHFIDHLAENHDQPAVTADGVPLELSANINGISDAQSATAMGATSVGLFRTEYLYLTHPGVPDEDEQFEIYSQIIKASPNHRVTIRTLDIGGDKTIPYLGHTHREANPFLGWRSIRLSFEYPEFFNTQLRAVLRAAAVAQNLKGSVQLMFPMITTVEELHKVRGMVRRVRKQLKAERKRFADVPMGMMLEVPAAAICLETMFDSTDFVSIGSNDLIQYLMAADRDNPKVSHLCQPLAPAVLRVLRSVIQSCRENNKPLTLCGEMAGQPRGFLMLLGMGLRSFSMSPAFIPYVKDLAKHIRVADAERIAKHAMTLKTKTTVRRYLTEQLNTIAPNFRRLDTTK